MYIVKITNNTPLCKMVNFSRSVLKIYTGQKKFTRAAPVAPVTNIRYDINHVSHTGGKVLIELLGNYSTK